jgi:hypothetical protein
MKRFLYAILLSSPELIFPVWGFELDSWLSELADDIPLVDIPIIPGSHNSGTCSSRSLVTKCVFPVARQQHLRIADQLESGVRLIDIRIRYDNSGTHMRVTHTLDTTYTFEQVLLEVGEFLDRHPSEFVAILLRGDWPPNRSFAPDKSELKKERVAELGNLLARSGINWAHGVSKESELKDVRGKGILISDWFHFDLDASLLQVPFIDKWENYELCDIWDDEQREMPALKISRFMQSDRVTNVGAVEAAKEQDGNRRPRVCSALPGSKLFTGVALDRTHAFIVPPCLTSHCWNEWFLHELEYNPAWRPQMNPPVPVGVVLIDFADRDTIHRLLQIAFQKWHFAPL